MEEKLSSDRFENEIEEIKNYIREFDIILLLTISDNPDKLLQCIRKMILSLLESAHCKDILLEILPGEAEITAANITDNLEEFIKLTERYFLTSKQTSLKKGPKFKAEKKLITVKGIYESLIALRRIESAEIKIESKYSLIWQKIFIIGFLFASIVNQLTSIDEEIDYYSRIKLSSIKFNNLLLQREQMEKENRELDLLLIKPLQYAEGVWKTSKKIIYHSEMADKIISRFPKLRVSKEILIEKLRPIARKYHYSDFSEGEFKRKTIMPLLCDSISKDNYRIKLNFQENTTDWLNEIIMTPDFYSKWFKKKGEIDLSPELNELIEDTHGFRKKKFSELTGEEQRKIKRLNRLLLEQTYHLTPKSRKFGLMRGHEGPKKGERY